MHKTHRMCGLSFALGHSYCGIITNGFPEKWNLQKPVNKLFAVETIHAEER